MPVGHRPAAAHSRLTQGVCRRPGWARRSSSGRGRSEEERSQQHQPRPEPLEQREQRFARGANSTGICVDVLASATSATTTPTSATARSATRAAIALRATSRDCGAVLARYLRRGAHGPLIEWTLLYHAYPRIAPPPQQQREPRPLCTTRSPRDTQLLPLLLELQRRQQRSARGTRGRGTGARMGRERLKAAVRTQPLLYARAPRLRVRRARYGSWLSTSRRRGNGASWALVDSSTDDDDMG